MPRVFSSLSVAVLGLLAVCGSVQCSISFTALTTAAPWEPRSVLGYGIASSSVSYTPVGTSSSATLPSGSLIMYGGSNLLPTNPNNGSGTYSATEHDVWGSSDGATWALIAGYTLAYSAGSRSSSSIPGAVSVTSPSQPGTSNYYGDAGTSLKCRDKNTGRMYLLSSTTTVSANTFSSLDGVTWVNMSAGFTVTPRQQAACATDSSSRIFLMQGANAAGANLNDVWMGEYNAASNTQTWTLQTAAAPWYGRNGAGADIYSATVLGGTEIISIAGGYQTDVSTGASNDVWASSDLGVTWQLVTKNAPWQVREHGWLIASSTGVLITTQGGPGEYQTDDLWISLDGGITWGSCTGSTLANQSEPWAARKNGAAFLDGSGYLWISGGQDQSYSSTYADGILYQAYNDVWKSTVSFTSSAATLAAQCGLTVPSCGVGLQCWPPSTNCTCTSSNGASAGAFVGSATLLSLLVAFFV